MCMYGAGRAVLEAQPWLVGCSAGRVQRWKHSPGGVQCLGHRASGTVVVGTVLGVQCCVYSAGGHIAGRHSAGWAPRYRRSAGGYSAGRTVLWAQCWWAQCWRGKVLGRQEAVARRDCPPHQRWMLPSRRCLMAWRGASGAWAGTARRSPRTRWPSATASMTLCIARSSSSACRHRVAHDSRYALACWHLLGHTEAQSPG